MNWALLWNSFLVSGLTTVLAVLLGLGAALTAATLEIRARSFLLLAAAAALMLPPFLVTGCWLDLLGQNGTWRPWVPGSIYSLGGAVWILTMLTWPISTFFALSAWSRLEAEQLEMDPRIRGWTLLRGVLWPMARPALGQAVVLTSVLALNNFSVPVILQVKVFPEELWLAFTTRLDEAGAWESSLPLVIMPFLLLIVLRHAAVAWPAQHLPAAPQALRRQLGRAWTWLAATITGLLLLISLALPLQQWLLNTRTWTELPNLFRAAPDTIWNSFAYAATAATASVGIGLVSWRLPAGLMLWLPFLIPGILLGRLMIALFNGTPIYGTVGLVILAYTLRYLAPAWTVVSLAKQSVDPDLTDAARGQGAKGWMLFRHVHWPQLAVPLASAWYVTYLLCLWDVETLVLIYPPGGETLALRIFNLLHYGHNAQVNALGVTLLGLAAAPLCLWRLGYALTHRRHGQGE